MLALRVPLHPFELAESDPKNAEQAHFRCRNDGEALWETADKHLQTFAHLQISMITPHFHVYAIQLEAVCRDALGGFVPINTLISRYTRWNLRRAF